MTAISAIRSMPIKAGEIPFCDKRFKFLRVSADSLSCLCLSIFFRAISFLYSAFSESASQYYTSLSQFQSNKSKNQWLVYRANQNSDQDRCYYSTTGKFGGQIVDFSYNSATWVKEFLGSGASEREEIEKMYGRENLDRWSRIARSEIPFDENKLARLEMNTDGCCFGMSMHFISNYFQALKSGLSTEEAVKSISPIYAFGAPDEAQLIQIVFNALNASYSWQHIENHLQEYFNPKREEEILTLMKIDDDLSYMSAQQEKHLPRYQKLKLESAELTKKIDDDEISGYRRLKIVTEKSKKVPFAGPLGFNLDFMTASISKSSRQDAYSLDDQFEGFYNQLPEGVYFVDTFQKFAYFPGDNLTKHAMVFIKTAAGNDYIFDPNYATFSVDKNRSAAQLWNIAKEFYSKNGLANLSFSLCQPL